MFYNFAENKHKKDDKNGKEIPDYICITIREQ